MEERRKIETKKFVIFLLEDRKGRYQVDVYNKQNAIDYEVAYDYLGFKMTEKELWRSFAEDLVDNEDLEEQDTQEILLELKKHTELLYNVCEHCGEFILPNQDESVVKYGTCHKKCLEKYLMYNSY